MKKNNVINFPPVHYLRIKKTVVTGEIPKTQANSFYQIARHKNETFYKAIIKL